MEMERDNGKGSKREVERKGEETKGKRKRKRKDWQGEEARGRGPALARAPVACGSGLVCPVFQLGCLPCSRAARSTWLAEGVYPVSRPQRREQRYIDMPPILLPLFERPQSESCEEANVNALERRAAPH